MIFQIHDSQHIIANRKAVILHSLHFFLLSFHRKAVNGCGISICRINIALYQGEKTAMNFLCLGILIILIGLQIPIACRLVINLHGFPDDRRQSLYLFIQVGEIASCIGLIQIDLYLLHIMIAKAYSGIMSAFYYLKLCLRLYSLKISADIIFKSTG